MQQALDSVIGGDDAEVRLLQRPDPQAMRAGTDQRQQIEMFARGLTAQLERIRPVDDMFRSAAAVDVEVAALRDDVQLRQRREARRTVAGWIAERRPLREQLSVDDSAAVLWTLTSPEVHHMFRVTWGWPPERYESWLRGALVGSLLA